MPIPTCGEDGVWPETNVATTRVLSCGAGISGSMSRACSAEGVWGEPDKSECGRFPTGV